MTTNDSIVEASSTPAAATATAAPKAPKEMFVFVGSYTKGRDTGIHVYKLDTGKVFASQRSEIAYQMNKTLGAEN